MTYDVYGSQEALSLEAVLLKPQMCIPGSEYTGAKAAPSEVAQHTLNVMRRWVVRHEWCRGSMNGAVAANEHISAGIASMVAEHACALLYAESCVP